MHSPAATQSALIVVGENQCSKAGYERGRLKKAIVGVGKAWYAESSLSPPVISY